MIGRAVALILALSMLAVPVEGEAQQSGKVARLGLIGLFTPELASRSVGAVREGLQELGWHEGQNMHFEQRYASGKRDQLGALAKELVEQRVDVIVAFGTDATRAAREVTSSIPVVMAAVGDPVGSGFVTNLARPGGNVTGTSLLHADIVGKQFQLLREVAPRASRIGVISLGVAAGPAVKEAEAAARRRGVKLHAVVLRKPSMLDDLAVQLRMARVDAILGRPQPGPR